MHFWTQQRRIFSLLVLTFAVLERYFSTMTWFLRKYKEPNTIRKVWKMHKLYLVLAYCPEFTMWKFEKFSNTQILREITFKHNFHNMDFNHQCCQLTMWRKTKILWHIFYVKSVFTLHLHSVEISWFFCYSDFTWNQFWRT